MNWMTKFLMGQMLLMDDAGDKGGGGGDKGDKGDGAAKELAELKENYSKLQAKMEEWEKKNTKPKENEDDTSLADKARKDREEKELKDADSKALESALKFNMASAQFLKDNASLLPKGIEGIFAKAEKENYANAVEKSAAIKVSLVQEYFAIQANLDLLTGAQKQMLEDFQALTNTVKNQRVQMIYDTVFEPALETSRKISKAKAVQKGMAEPNDSEDAYEKRMIGLSKQHHLGERKNA